MVEEVQKIELAVTQVVYINPYNEQIQDELELDERDGSLLNHKNYLDYSCRSKDEIMFDSYDEASDFFTECYSHLLQEEHWMDLNEDGTISYVSWDRCEKLNVDLTVVFLEVDET